MSILAGIIAGCVGARSSGVKSALLHFDGSNGSTVFTDEVGNIWTPNGAAAISTAQSKFGGSSGYFNGSNAHLSAPSVAAFNLTSGDWTIETFIYLLALTSGNQTILNKDGVFGSSYAQYDLNIASNGKLGMFLGTGTGTGSQQSFGGTSVIPLNTWIHVAASRAGSTVRGFLGGGKEWEVNQTTTMTDGGKALLAGYQTGQPVSSRFNGYMDELRITKGAAIYTGPFIPPTAPFI